jgi:hypothetical protein
MHRPEPLRHIPVAPHREPGPAGIVDTAIRRGGGGKERPHEEEDLQHRRSGHARGIIERHRRLAEIFPGDEAGADIPCQRRRDQKGYDPRHRAKRQRA